MLFASHFVLAASMCILYVPQAKYALEVDCYSHFSQLNGQTTARHPRCCNMQLGRASVVDHFEDGHCGICLPASSTHAWLKCQHLFR